MNFKKFEDAIDLHECEGKDLEEESEGEKTRQISSIGSKPHAQ